MFLRTINIHWMALILSAAVGGIYASHHFFISRTLDAGQTYYPVTLAVDPDGASFYAHRAHAAYLGQWIIGDIHTSEHEGGPAIMPMLNPLILGFMGRIGGSMKNGFIASDFVFPAIIFLLVYAICYELSRRRLPSMLLSALFIFVPTLGTAFPPVSLVHIKKIVQMFLPFRYGESTLFFSNFEEPKITFIFFAFAVWCIMRAVSQKTPLRTACAGMSLGILFYTYLFDWVTILVALVLLLFMFVFWLKDYNGGKHILHILVIGFAVSIPYWINLWMLYHAPYAGDIIARAGREIGHAFRIATAWKSYIRIVALTLLLHFFALSGDGIRRQKLAIIIAFLFSYAVVLNVQVVTGFNIHPDHWYRVQFLPIMLAVFLLALVFYDRFMPHRMRVAGTWLAGIFLVYFLGGQMYYQYMISSDIAYAQNFTIPHARHEAYQWLTQHTSKGSVVAALSFETNREVPLYTHNKIYVPHGLLTFASDQEIWNRFFFVNALFGITPEMFRDSLEKGDGVYYLFEERYGSHEFDSSFLGYERKFPEDMIRHSTQMYTEYIATKHALAPAYRLDYIMTDSRDGTAGKNLELALYLKKVYDIGGVKIYTLQDQ